MQLVCICCFYKPEVLQCAIDLVVQCAMDLLVKCVIEIYCTVVQCYGSLVVQQNVDYFV